jgi:TRAP-type C4-dicarboxylate transport system substrate-binding protein
MNFMGRAAAALGFALIASQASAADYRMLVSWERHYPPIPILVDSFVKGVEQGTQGRVKIIVNGPETVSPFEQLQPVAAGAFQMLFTHGIYHFNQTGIGAGFDAIGGSYEKRRDSGIFEALDKMYQRLGLKVIAVPVSQKSGYTFQLKAPVGADGDLKGRKIRGTATYHPLIRMLGGAPVVMPIGETYTSLEKGVVDGAASPVVGLLGVKWYEVAKYVAQPAFGNTHQLFLMNLAAWNRLSETDQKILLEEGRKTEVLWFNEYVRLAEEETKELVARGSTLTQLGSDPAKINAVWTTGLWDLAETKSPAEVKELRALAKAKGLID